MRRLILVCGFLLLLPLSTLGRSTHGVSDLATEQQMWWGDMARGYVVSGCLPAVPTPASRTLSLPPCRAYALETGGAGGPRRQAYLSEETAQPWTLAASDGTTWLATHVSVAEAVPGWTRLPGTHYLWQSSTNAPLAPDGGVLVARIKVAGGVVTTISDLRPDSPQPGAPANLRAPLFGAAADCVTDDTAAIQAWINNAAQRNVTNFAPAGCYLFSRVWFNYDPVNNPGHPDDAISQGDLLVRGEGIQMKLTQSAFGPQWDWPGTVFKSTEPTNPAFNASVPPGAALNLLHGLMFEGFSLIQKSTGFVMDVVGGRQRSGIRQLYIEQQGTGSGLKWQDMFFVSFDDSAIIATGSNEEGIGFWFFNDDTVGGIIRLDNINTSGFGAVGIRAGTDVALSANRLQSVYMHGVQGSGSKIGLEILGAGRGVACHGCYFEGFSQFGVNIRENAQGVTIANSWFQANQLNQPTDAAIHIGQSGTGLPGGAKGVTIANNVILEVYQGSGIYRDVGAEVYGAVIYGNDILVNENSHAGIYCGTGGLTTQNNLVIFGNYIHGIGNFIDPSCRSGEIIQDSSAIYLGRRVNFGQGATVEAADAITLPANGNVYALMTGTAPVTTLLCTTCTQGAMVWFYVPIGNTPTMSEVAGGNIDLDSTAGNTWTGSSNDVIAFVWGGAKWLEMFRKQN